MDESEIPIDIHTSKLMDWLISRRHVQRDWQTKIITIREKINEAIKDMPEEPGITALLSGSYINYYHCQKIVEILKETEANTKNIFGQYSSKRMKDWLEIMKLYEKDNIYLGEVASLLLRNVNYEVPALKKQISRTVHLRNEYDRKESDYEKWAESGKKEYNAICKSLGIKGIKIKQELVEKSKEFPVMCEEITKEVKSLKPAVNFYQKAVQALLDSEKYVLEMLQYIIDNGNTTVYQWKYKKVPSSVETIAFTVEDDTGINENEDVIDFGFDTDTKVDEEIDWGISAVDVESNAAIENDKTVARGEEARTVLGHPETRNSLINDIIELEAFLKLRCYEMNSETDGLSLTMLPDALQLYDIKTVNEMLQKVESIFKSLNNPVSLHYLNIITNPRYIDQLADKLKQKLNTQEKMLASRDCVRAQREEAIKEGEALQPKLQLLIQKSKELQDLIEQDISRRYKGRPVNLIAGANLL